MPAGRSIARPGLVLLILMVVGGCSSAAPSGTAGQVPSAPTSSGAGPSPAGGPAALTIFAAASLKNAIDDAKAAYQAALPGSQLTISTDSSATLEAQIELGAPADLFLSADSSNPQKLVDKGLAAGKAVVFAGNKLTIIVPAANPGAVRSPADLARPGVGVIAAGETVPITTYAGQVVQKLGQLTGYPAGFAAAYAANIKSREDNVRAVVAKIELGEGDAAIVYVTDARASSKVSTIELPDAANVPASYSGVVVKASPNASAARGFLDWFAGPAGRLILARHGFLPPG